LSTRTYLIGWIILIVTAAVWEIAGVIQGRGMLTSFFFGLQKHPWAFATVTAFMTWWYYHWVVESGLFPALKGPGPDDLGVFTLAWLLTFFGQRKK